MTTVSLKNEGRIEDPLITGKAVGKMLCDAVGIPIKGVAEITLSIKVNEPATVNIKRFMTKGESEGFTEKLTQFVLCRPEDIQGGDDE